VAGRTPSAGDQSRAGHLHDSVSLSSASRRTKAAACCVAKVHSLSGKGSSRTPDALCRSTHARHHITGPAEAQFNPLMTWRAAETVPLHGEFGRSMSVRLLLHALGHPSPDAALDDDTALGRCVAWLEDTKVRALPPDSRQPLRDVTAATWETAFAQVRSCMCWFVWTGPLSPG
jgi:RNA transcription, translation and transport factor protein